MTSAAPACLRTAAGAVLLNRNPKGLGMNLRQALHHRAQHKARRLGWLDRLLCVPARCIECGEAWPCRPAREARAVVIEALRAAGRASRVGSHWR